jgi:hypothetical protein
MFVLYEIIGMWEGPKKKIILEISENREPLEILVEIYTANYNHFVAKVDIGRAISSDIQRKMKSEYPNPILLEQQKITAPLTEKQQKIRRKIGMENAQLVTENNKRRNEVFEREMKLLSEYERDCLAISKDGYKTCKYVIEETISRNPSFGVNTF